MESKHKLVCEPSGLRGREALLPPAACRPQSYIAFLRSVHIPFHPTRTSRMSALSIRWFVLLLLGCALQACQQAEEERPVGDIYSHEYYRYQPWRQLGELFHDVQMQQVFEDSKTFVDSRPKRNPAMILWRYRSEKDEPDFDLENFVHTHFIPPENTQPEFERDPELDMLEHLRTHWDYLQRDADPQQGLSTLIPLPRQYVVPGGRFREIYYWDSYFTLRGLAVSDESALVQSMLQNFSWMAESIGHIPNGNRTYYLSRSQPPYFAAMVSLWREQVGDEAAVAFLPQLEEEHGFWMNGAANLDPGQASRRVVRMPDGALLNRYWDDRAEPRPESYREDVLTAEPLPADEQAQLYRNIRAAAESGWDFSSRWMGNGSALVNTQTTAIVPVDLNSLLFHLETVISELAVVAEQPQKAEQFAARAEARRQAITQWLWDEEQSFYVDWHFENQAPTAIMSLAAVYPLYFGIAQDVQARAVAGHLQSKFLMQGGLVTTLTDSGEQWDYPNGWAPLQWLAVRGLKRYGHDELANEVARRWLALNRKVFEDTGRMMEKYNVVDTSLQAGGGEYPLQDGFGWTNGVALALAELLQE